MNPSLTLGRAGASTKHGHAYSGDALKAPRTSALATLTALTVLWLPAPARAVDGCLVLLCFAAPSWRAIPQCVPPIRQVLKDLARGRPFPSCGMAGAGNSAAHRWASAPAYCPPQYTTAIETEGGPVYHCSYRGAVSVRIAGSPWARTWWNRSGDSVTEYTDTAKAQLGDWDTRFDDDYAVWVATQPPAPPPCTGDC